MPLIVVPIRTEAAVRRTPVVNFLLIAANIVAFALFNSKLFGDGLSVFAHEHLYFRSYTPAFHQFFVYQFLHGDFWHLLGNMLFLWVFGNSVCCKMGDGPYLLFYLACGAFAAWTNAVLKSEPFSLIGASGSIAGVTTAYLALFPRSHVTVLVWFFFLIQFFELPAMVIIGLKIIVWDNIVAPSLGGSDQVAHLAHLGGYLFGFAGALMMLLVRALPRDQFDILALWNRWTRRRAWKAAMADPAAAARATFGAVGRPAPHDPRQRELEDRYLNQVAELRGRIAEELGKRALASAIEQYERLQALSPRQCLPETQQLEIAREYFGTGRFAPAAAAFERFVECYPDANEAPNVKLLVGIIYARDLRQYEVADRLLTQSMATLRDEERRAQCLEWLRNVRVALGRPAPDLAGG